MLSRFPMEFVVQPKDLTSSDHFQETRSKQRVHITDAQLIVFSTQIERLSVLYALFDDFLKIRFPTLSLPF